MKSSISRRYRAFLLGACVAVAAIVAAETASSSSAHVAVASTKTSSAPLVVWYDGARAAYVKEYKATHPHANIKWVLYSGDNNGDGTLQSKFSLYNRVGWKAGVAPDVVFDEENYEAGWLGLPPFNDLARPASIYPEERVEQGRRPGRLHDQREASVPAQRQCSERAVGEHEAVESVLPRQVAADNVGGVRGRRPSAGQGPPGLLHR